MKLCCKKCRAKYLIGDEKLQSQVFKFRCRKCGVIIQIDNFQVSIHNDSEEPAASSALLEHSFIESFCGAGAAEGHPRLFVSIKPPERILKQKGVPFHWSVAIDNQPWFVLVGDETEGPMNARDVGEGLQSNRYEEQSLVWKEGMPDWVSLRNCRGLLGLIATLDRLEPVKESKRAASAEPIPSVVPRDSDPPAPDEPKIMPKIIVEQKYITKAIRQIENGDSEAPAPDEHDMMDEAFARMKGIFKMQQHDDAAAFALSLARQIIDCEAGACMLVAPGMNQLYVAAAEGPIAQSLYGMRISPHKGVIGQVSRNHMLLNVRDPERDPRFDPSVDIKKNFHTRNVLCASIHCKGQTMGTIELLNSPRKEGFGESDENVLSYISTAFAEFADTSLPERDGFRDDDFVPTGKKWG
ncbi:MAG: DUF4339 domain-containing protein [Deltaproteobacteria bacterium]|nr:DUF4339 domain-containing protein [Deltaproteobacteria bacterium]